MSYFLVPKIKINFYSSKKIGDYNSCSVELSEKFCTICDSNVHRGLKLEGSDSYCKCIPGFYENYQNICTYCHYTW